MLTSPRAAGTGYSAAIAIAAALLLGLAACAGSGAERVARPACFSARPTVVVPDRAKIMPHLTNGAAGRDLIDALYRGDAAQVTEMLARDPRLATTEVGNGNAPAGAERPVGQYGDLLTLAVAQCDAAMLRALLAAGLPPDGVQRGGPLTLALLADSPDMAMLLLDAGASPDPQKSGGRDVLREMIMFGHEGAVSLLLRHGLDVNWADRFGVGRLQVAVDAEQFRVAEQLHKAGASLWAISGTGHMPVHILQAPMIQANREQDAARERLLAAARLPGLPWPPPPPKEVRAMVMGGNWPTPALEAAGLPMPRPEALADMKARALR